MRGLRAETLPRCDALPLMQLKVAFGNQPILHLSSSGMPASRKPDCAWEMRRGALPDAQTILIAVGDAVLADSLRFSLELEGFDAKLCDERSLVALANAEAPGCLVLDQEIFSRLADGDGNRAMARLGIPVVLMVGYRTQRLMDRVRAAGVKHVVEKPLLGGVLFDEIRKALDGDSGPEGNSGENR
jgi:FixJ family two-component response regulator